MNMAIKSLSKAVSNHQWKEMVFQFHFTLKSWSENMQRICLMRKANFEWYNNYDAMSTYFWHFSEWLKSPLNIKYDVLKTPFAENHILNVVYVYVVVLMF